MRVALLKMVRFVLWASMLLLAVVAGCSVPAGDGETHPACEMPPQTLPAIESSSASLEGDENVSTTQEALTVSCKMKEADGFKDGKKFKIKVVTVDGKPVEWKTANAFVRMAKAAAKDGVQIRVVSGFRTMAEQQFFWNCFQTCSCNDCNEAAPPGFSNHQSGHALDLNTLSPGVFNWLTNHGGKYGFKRTVPSEAWHWEWWGQDEGRGPCNADTLKAKLGKKSSNAKRFRGKKADYIVCAGKPFEISFTFKNKGTAIWRDVKGRGNSMGSDVFLVTASGKKDKLTGKTRLSLRRNKNNQVRGDRKAKNCDNKDDCRKTTFIKGGIRAKAPSKPGIYRSRWRLRDYSRLHGKKSQGFGPKAELRFKVVSCDSAAPCGCTVWCTDGTKHKVAADTSSAQCKSAGVSMCEPAQYLAHEFVACPDPEPEPGTGGTGGTSGTGGTAGSGGSAEPLSFDEPTTEPEDDPSFPPEGDDPNAISSVEGEAATSGTEEPDDEDFEDDPSFEGEEEELAGGEYELGHDAGCSVGTARGSTSSRALLALVALGLAIGIRRRR